MSEEQGDLLVCVESCQFDVGDDRLAFHPGAIVLASDPVVRGRENLFVPLVVVVSGSPDLPLSYARIQVVGDSDKPGYRKFLNIQSQIPAPSYLVG